MREHDFEVLVDGVSRTTIRMDLFSNNDEILVELRKTQLFSGRKAEFFGSVRDKLDIVTTQGTFTLRNVSL